MLYYIYIYVCIYTQYFLFPSLCIDIGLAKKFVFFCVYMYM